jgi:hypothetical protein
VAEESLKGPQVSAGLKVVSGKAVPHRVWTHRFATYNVPHFNEILINPVPRQVCAWITTLEEPVLWPIRPIVITKVVQQNRG